MSENWNSIHTHAKCKSTWVKKKKNFTQVEKHIQILAMFRNSATVKSNISVFIKKLNFRNNYREKISFSNW